MSASRPAPRFVVAVLDPIDESGQERYAVVDGDEVVCYAAKSRVFDLARYLNALGPVAAFLVEDEYGYLLRRMKPGLRFDGTCHRCGAVMPAGTPGWWHPLTGVTRHVGRCPKPAAAAVRKRSKAA